METLLELDENEVCEDGSGLDVKCYGLVHKWAIQSSAYVTEERQK